MVAAAARRFHVLAEMRLEGRDLCHREEPPPALEVTLGLSVIALAVPLVSRVAVIFERLLPRLFSAEERVAPTSLFHSPRAPAQPRR
jgi:hypothetical protein